MLDESKQTHCTCCNVRYDSNIPDKYHDNGFYVQWLALSGDDRLLAQPDSLGYCENCKQAYYSENREQIFKAYQTYLDSFPTPANIYGLIDPRYRLIYYIGRTYHLERRIREHRRGQDPRAAYTRELHEQGLTFEWCKLATVIPGCYVYEMESRWICHAIQQGWPLTNIEAQPDYSYAVNASKEATTDFFTCSSFALPCGNRMTIRRVEMYARWLESKPAEISDKQDFLSEWSAEFIFRPRAAST